MAGDWQGRVGLRRRGFLPTLGRPQPFPSSVSPPPSRAVFTRASPSPQRPSFVFSLWTTRCPPPLRRHSPLRVLPLARRGAKSLPIRSTRSSARPLVPRRPHPVPARARLRRTYVPPCVPSCVLRYVPLLRSPPIRPSQPRLTPLRLGNQWRQGIWQRRRSSPLSSRR